ncbi:hypothetical protein [uncultured Tateyamaria sp.]|uniref:hypothetical protein n=1 Tax=uncultured Tateyamaria sp. TaxID=455651 RepID=UPI0026054A44|nr:hypothetical protein [uncultured Tateyamaria sp.]
MKRSKITIITRAYAHSAIADRCIQNLHRKYVQSFDDAIMLHRPLIVTNRTGGQASHTGTETKKMALLGGRSAIWWNRRGFQPIRPPPGPIVSS